MVRTGFGQEWRTIPDIPKARQRYVSRCSAPFSQVRGGKRLPPLLCTHPCSQVERRAVESVKLWFGARRRFLPSIPLEPRCVQYSVPLHRVGRGKLFSSFLYGHVHLCTFR